MKLAFYSLYLFVTAFMCLVTVALLMFCVYVVCLLFLEAPIMTVTLLAFGWVLFFVVSQYLNNRYRW